MQDIENKITTDLNRQKVERGLLYPLIPNEIKKLFIYYYKKSLLEQGVSRRETAVRNYLVGNGNPPPKDIEKVHLAYTKSVILIEPFIMEFIEKITNHIDEMKKQEKELEKQLNYKHGEEAA